MRTLFMLGIALIVFLLSNSFIVSPLSQTKDTAKYGAKISDAAWEKVHLMIERSPVDTVKASFELIVNKNAFKTAALKIKTI